MFVHFSFQIPPTIFTLCLYKPIYQPSMHQFNTQRLYIREVQQEDLHPLHQLHSIPSVAEFNTYTLHLNLETTQNLLEDWLEEQKKVSRSQFIFSIFSDSTFIGIIALSLCANRKLQLATVWYLILPAFWGKGFATETLKGLFNYAFTHLRLHRIEAGAAIGNVGSLRVMEKAGMIQEGRKRKVLPLSDGWSDNYEYAILKEDWEQIK